MTLTVVSCSPTIPTFEHKEIPVSLITSARGYNRSDQSDSPAPSIAYDHEVEAPFIDQPRQKF